MLLLRKQEKWQRLEQEYTELNTNFLSHKELNFFFHLMLTEPSRVLPVQRSYSNEQIHTHRTIVTLRVLFLKDIFFSLEQYVKGF